MNMTSRTEIRARSKANAHAALDLKDALIALRKKHGLSQAEVAARMGVSQPTVSEVERYDSNPTLRTIQKYANAVMGNLELKAADGCCPTPSAGEVADHWDALGSENAERTKAQVGVVRFHPAENLLSRMSSASHDAAWMKFSRADFGLAR